MTRTHITCRLSRAQTRLCCRCRTISVSTQVQGGDFNLYEGMRCHGVPLVIISRGRLVCENGVFMCAEGSGKFYPQRTFPDYLYKKMVQREKVRSRNHRAVTLFIRRRRRLCVASCVNSCCTVHYDLRLVLTPLRQTQAYKSVVRDPYSGDVAKVANSMKKELGLGPIDGESANKPCNRAHQGVRDLHESSFSLSGGPQHRKTASG